jgi:hypothetical protein
MHKLRTGCGCQGFDGADLQRALHVLEACMRPAILHLPDKMFVLGLACLCWPARLHLLLVLPSGAVCLVWCWWGQGCHVYRFEADGTGSNVASIIT